MSSMLKDDIRKPASMVTKTKEKRTFRSLREQILRSGSEFLTLVENSSSSYSVHTDFSKGEGTDNIDGLFMDTGLTGLLEAKDNGYVDMVFLLVVAVVDRCSFLVDAFLTKCVVRFVELFQNRLLCLSTRLARPACKCFGRSSARFSISSSRSFENLQTFRHAHLQVAFPGTCR